MYILSENQRNNTWLIYPCACVVEETSTSVSNFVPIYAYSLNDAGFSKFIFTRSVDGNGNVKETYRSLTRATYNSFWANVFLPKELLHTGKRIVLLQKMNQ